MSRTTRLFQIPYKLVFVTLLLSVTSFAFAQSKVDSNTVIKKVDATEVEGVTFDKRLKIDFDKDGVLDIVSCIAGSATVRVTSGAKGKAVLYEWVSPVTPDAKNDVANITGCALAELTPGNFSIVVAGVVSGAAGARGLSEQFVLYNNGKTLVPKLIKNSKGDNYTSASRDVNCTAYPGMLVKNGYNPGTLCFFSGYDTEIGGGKGTKTTLVKIETNGNNLVYKHITGSSDLPWKGGDLGTSKNNIRTYEHGGNVRKFDGLHMMDSAFLDYDKDGLVDLITVGQHASIRASKMVFDKTRPEGIRFTTSNILTASSKVMTEFLSITGFNEHDKTIDLACVYISGEMDRPLTTHSVPDHVRCYVDGNWVMYPLPGGPFNSEYEGATIAQDARGVVYIYAPDFIFEKSNLDVSGVRMRNNPESNIFRLGLGAIDKIEPGLAATSSDTAFTTVTPGTVSTKISLAWQPAEKVTGDMSLALTGADKALASTSSVAYSQGRGAIKLNDCDPKSTTESAACRTLRTRISNSQAFTVQGLYTPVGGVQKRIESKPFKLTYTAGEEASCLVGGTYVPHKTAKVFYSAAQTTGLCNKISQSRTCTNGVLSGEKEFSESSCVGKNDVVPTTPTISSTSTTPTTPTTTLEPTPVSTPKAAPNCTLIAAPITIEVGGSAKLTWTAKNAVSGQIDNEIGGIKLNNAEATRTIEPNKNTTYTLTVKNEAGASAICKVVVKVKPKAAAVSPAAETEVNNSVKTPVAPTAPAAPKAETVTPIKPSCVLTLTPATIKEGGTSVLAWTTKNAKSATINHDIGSVNPNNKDGSRNLSPAKTTSYQMVVTSSDGTTAKCNIELVVKVSVVEKVSLISTAIGSQMASLFEALGQFLQTLKNQ